MAKEVSFLPVYETDNEYNATILRQSIPMMAKHNIAPHPINYAIWYDYASGENKALTVAVDKLLAKGQTFSDSISLDLYKTYICNASIDSFEKINTSLKTLLVNTSSTVQDSGKKVNSVGEKFKQSAAQLDEVNDVRDMKSVLAGIVTETSQLLSISESLKKELHQAHQDMESMRNELTKVREMATTDGLTGLLNRRAFDSKLLEMVDAGSKGGKHALIILDLDHFKRINDTFGHLVGDKVIRYMSSLLQKQVAAHHFPARYGGEEMAVIMPDTSLELAVKVAETVRQGLAKSQLKQKDNGLTLGKVTVSVGVTALESADTVESLIARADGALYEAKQNGRNQVVAR